MYRDPACLQRVTGISDSPISNNTILHAATCLLPELWEIIIGFLQDDTVDLKSTSLACRSFVFACPVAYIPRNPNYGEEKGVQANRLTALMESSPHLIRHVRSLTVEGCEPEMVIPLARIRWSRVDTLELEDITEDLSDDCARSIHTLVGLSSLCTLTIRNCCHAEQLHTILSHCSAALENVSLRSCEISPTPAFRPLKSPRPRQRIRKLVLPCMSLDLTSLNHLHLTRMTVARLDSFLRRICSTVECLSVDARDYISSSLDLSLLPALVHIDCHGFGNGPVLNTMLGGMPTDNHINTIHLFAPRAVIVMDHLPALREVSLTMYIEQHRQEDRDPYEFNHPGLMQVMVAALPRLHEKGMLSMHICLT
ncbi:hypothetical protein B0H14DRAFT_2924009 [Mycena olivaceomarginata]|nr:hypothetical protein B0H14DRAFT_2924009 [Mycena olivaceomarginata]